MTVPVLAVLWSGGGLVAVDKPPGLPVVPGRDPTRGPDLRTLLERQLGTRVWVVHRLDRDTSGVLLLATSPDAHRAASVAFERRAAEKIYAALVSPPLPGPVVVEAPLVPARRSRMRVAGPGEAGAPAVSELVPIETLGDVQVVEARPRTGRTHQLRVHLRHAGAPLLVDAQYGRPDPVTAARFGGPAGRVLLARTPLHATRLVLPPAGGLPGVDVVAPWPADMTAVRLAARSQAGAVAPGQRTVNSSDSPE